MLNKAGIKRFLEVQEERGKTEYGDVETLYYFVTIPWGTYAPKITDEKSRVRAKSYQDSVSEHVATVMSEHVLDCVKQTQKYFDMPVIHASHIKADASGEQKRGNLNDTSWTIYHELEETHQVNGFCLHSNTDIVADLLAEELERDDTEPLDVYVGTYQWQEHDVDKHYLRVDNLEAALVGSLTLGK